MLPKVRYRLVWNYANKLNMQGQAPVALECRQGKRKIYLSTKIYLYPYQWLNGTVINHQNAAKLMAYLVKYRNSIEEVESNALLKGRRLSLSQLKMAVLE